MNTTPLYEVFTAYYYQAVRASEKHDFKVAADSFEKAFDVLGEIRTECLRKYAGRKITRVRTPEEIELERLKGVVTGLRNQLGDLFLELDDLETELGKFQADYNCRVGKLYLELDKLDYEIKMLRLKMERFHTGKSYDDQSILDELADLAGQLLQDEEQFHEDEATVKTFQDNAKRLSDEEKRELRNLYRDLAKIYHPDKARSESELSYFDEVMKAINDAYHQSDLDILKKIEAKAQIYIEVEQIGESLSEKITRFRQEESKLVKLVTTIQTKIQQIKTCDSFQLKIRVQSFESGPDAYYSGLIDDLRGRIRRKAIEKTRLAEQFSLLTAATQEHLVIL